MERLNTIERPAGSAIESAIHLARYAIALGYCHGRRVLDVSCGEGYGSKLLKDAGASQVDGVDISKKAITRACAEFKSEGITFHCADALKIDELFEENTFDLIVSIETIEHLTDPISFLNSIKRIARNDAIIIITCPNDHWYYPSNDVANPFHIRKYSFAEFKRLISQVFDNKVKWGFGTAAFGFGNVTLTENNDIKWNQLGKGSWVTYRHQRFNLMTPGMDKDKLGTDNCSYYFGIWGSQNNEDSAGTAVFPISMDFYNLYIDALDCYNITNKTTRAIIAERDMATAELYRVNTELTQSREQISAIIAERDTATAELYRVNTELTQSREQITHLERDVQKFRLQAAALTAENNIMRRSIQESTVVVNKLSSDHTSLITERDFLITERDSLITERDSLITERDSLITERDSLITERDSLITERDSLVAERDQLLVTARRYYRIAVRLNKLVPQPLYSILRRIARRLMS